MLRKIAVLLALWAITSVSATYAEEAKPKEATEAKDPREIAAELIAKLPSQALLDEAYTANPMSDKQRELLARASEIVQQIRALLKPGTLVFAYPGLPGIGRISYYGKGKDGERYEQYIGFPPGREGAGKSDFIVVFDEKGVIHEVKSVDWKK